jgi:MOSC domain-containing protein YiiM
MGSLTLTESGAVGDYNHYRTVALDRTIDRAVSILTSDVMEVLRSITGYETVQDGDLGENVYVDGVPYGFFGVGKRYRFSESSFQTNGAALEGRGDGVVIEITEEIQPCGNLCRLPYLNDPRAKPKERLDKCKEFLFLLGQRRGMRGWYGKVVEGGVVSVGDRVSVVGDGVVGL